MAVRRLVVSLATGIMLMAGTVVAAPGSAGASTTVAAVVNTGPNSTCSDAYRDGDSRLGPAQLPTTGELAPIVRNYNPLAGLSASQFITTYWDPTANGGQGGWRYPPDNGYLLVNGQPIERHLPLGAGQRVDRFGSEFGAFLAPEGTPYSLRALPPMSLDNFDPAFTCNYHEYRVVKSFQVDSGPIAPGFGQPGLGRQYQLDSSLVPGAPSRLTVLWLIQNGYLARID